MVGMFFGGVLLEKIRLAVVEKLIGVIDLCCGNRVG